MDEDINELLARLNFSKKESKRAMSTNKTQPNLQGYEVWAVGKIMSDKKTNKEAMYRMLKSLWFTKEPVSFVVMTVGVFLVKFGNVDDRTRIFNLAPWLFNKYLFVMLPFVKVYNILFEEMDRQVAINVREVMGEILAIYWRDRKSCWIDYIRNMVKIDVSRPLQQVFHLVRNEGIEIKCPRQEELPRLSSPSFQNGNWLRVQLGGPNQNRGNWRNSENNMTLLNGKEKVMAGEEGLKSCSPMDKRPIQSSRDGGGRVKFQRKRMKGINGESNDQS
ncbi:hypothetical protein ES288_A07G227500v1 [Gossypium darwinii]|uniref:Uncharacterized protein n=1 Tax=Gossypium darwinii TaxID=34276 RepID=A0A5D2G0X5_GOSDA|nr:hypothetical protein ES288_A07G227500v1 [Gossypium darwinii]